METSFRDHFRLRQAVTINTRWLGLLYKRPMHTRSNYVVRTADGQSVPPGRLMAVTGGRGDVTHASQGTCSLSRSVGSDVDAWGKLAGICRSERSGETDWRENDTG